MHCNAELSGHEAKTNKIINKWLVSTNPDLLIPNIGGYGIAAVYKGKEPGRRIMLRADIDALKIPEGDKTVSHRCGHDGHAAIMCGVAQRLSKTRPERGEAVLLFQPAEETGQGAEAVIKDPVFQQIKPDLAFALHNIPSYARHSVLMREGCFAAASHGLKIVFEGATAHASQQETGKSPLEAMNLMLDAFRRKAITLKNFKPLTMLTVTHASLGEETFGVAPGIAEIWLTLRSYDNEKLHTLTSNCIDLCQLTAMEYGLGFRYSIHEAFPATMNNDLQNKMLETAASELNLNVVHLEEPFRWSEDFGRFGEVCPTAMFGLGCGLEHAPLHDVNYIFEDEIIDTGVDIFEKLIRMQK